MERSNVVATLAVIVALVAIIRPLDAEEAFGSRAKPRPDVLLPKADARNQLGCTWSEALATLLLKVDAIDAKLDRISNKLDHISHRQNRVERVHEELEFFRRIVDEIRHKPVVEETFVGGEKSRR